MRYVILPQALRIAIPPTVGFLVQLVKNTSLACGRSGCVELARAGQLASGSAPIEPFAVFTAVACHLFRPLLPADPVAARTLERRRACRLALEIQGDQQESRRQVARVLKDVCARHRQRGEVVAVIGRSGSGKSTLLRCINGLEPIQAGTISVDGMRVNDPQNRPAPAPRRRSAWCSRASTCSRI